MATKTWTIAASGNWNASGNWTGGIPLATDDALINVAGGYTVSVTDTRTVATLTLADPAGTLAINLGQTLNVTQLQFVSGTLLLSGILTGTVAYTGGTFQSNNGSLQNVTWKGQLNVSGPSSSGNVLNFQNGITVTDAAGTGNGVINAGQNNTLFFINSATLAGVTGATLTINAGSGTTIQTNTIVSALTIASNTSIVQSSGSAADLSIIGNGTIDNFGTVSGNGIVGGSFTDNVYFINETSGLLALPGEQFTVQNDGLRNLGIINVGSASFGGSIGLDNRASFTAAALRINTASISNSGVLNLLGASSNSEIQNNGGSPTLINTGTINLRALHTLTVSETLTGSGVVNIDNTATLDIVADTGGTIDFRGPSGVLALENAGTLGATVFGFRSGAGGAVDQIDLKFQRTVTDVVFAGNATGGTLTVLNGATTLDVIPLAGADYRSATFAHPSDGNGGTFITTSNTACFAAGTQIRTTRGEVAVEDLDVGDLVVTPCGVTDAASRPVRWIGTRRIDLDRHPDPRSVAPIRIAAGAFADRQPARDLLLSPDHAMFVDGVLVRAGDLMNGGTIRQEPARGAVTYFHVELDAHDVLLAEGLPAESYIDTGNRADFANGFAKVAARVVACAPFVTGGPLIEAIRARVAERVSGRVTA